MDVEEVLNLVDVKFVKVGDFEVRLHIRAMRNLFFEFVGGVI
jgi:hypothetical protein